MPLDLTIAAARLLNVQAFAEPIEPEPADEDAGDPPPAEAPPSDRFAALAGLLLRTPLPTQLGQQDAAQSRREEEASKVAEGLKSPGPNPPPTQKELDDLAAAVNAADDDAAVRLAANPRALELMTPQQKAALIRKLSAGATNDAEERAIMQILLSCKSSDEMQQVVQMSGGIQAIADELESDQLQAVIGHANQLAQKQEAAVTQAILLLEQAETPEEFERLYKQLGGDSLKHKLPRPPSAEVLSRLEALGEKYGIAGVGFGMPPEKTIALMTAIQKAIDDEDCDAIVRLSENSDAMRVASAAQKAQMIRQLQDGWTKDSQDMAIARILASCGSKAEFDQVVDMAGGPQILADVDFDEAKSLINKLMGGFGRLDCADDPATAQAYLGTLMPPAVDELSRTRAPTAAERDGVLGASPYSAQDLQDPAIAAVARDQDGVRQRIGKQAYDVQADPMARNQLALKNRERQLNGQPPLDYASLTARAYEVVNDPSFQADVERAIAESEKKLGKLDDEKKQEIREKVLEARLGAVAKEFGLSEQELKTLVVAKMGRLLQEGAQALAAVAEEHVARLEGDRLSNPFAPLPHLAESHGANDSPETRARVDRIRQTTGAWASRLQVTGATVENLFKVPPSFAENLVKALSVVGDVLAAAVNLIPGVGQAISGVYFGVKAIVGVATGDFLGAFKSLLSAVPGLGLTGILGAAKAGIETAAKAVQTGISAIEGIAGGDAMKFIGAMGSAGGLAVKDITWIGSPSALATAELGIYGMKLAPQVGGVVDGLVRGDDHAAFESIGRIFDELDGWQEQREKFLTWDESRKAKQR